MEPNSLASTAGLVREHGAISHLAPLHTRGGFVRIRHVESLGQCLYAVTRRYVHHLVQIARAAGRAAGNRFLRCDQRKCLRRDRR